MSSGKEFTVNNLFTLANNFGTAIVDGVFPASGSFVDLANFPWVMFIVRVGTLDSALVLQVHQDTSATQTASVKDVTGATLTVAADDDNELKVIEVQASQLDLANDFRFVTLDITGAAGANDFLDIIVVGRDARHKPVTQPATVTSDVTAG